MPVLQHLLQLIVDELNLRSDDDLAGSLAGRMTPAAPAFLTAFVNSGVILIPKRRRVAQ